MESAVTETWLTSMNKTDKIQSKQTKQEKCLRE